MQGYYPEQIETAGAADGDALLFDSTLDRMEFGPVVLGLVQGAGVTIDNTDPSHPVVAATGGSGAAWGRPFPIDLPPAVPNAKDDEFDGTSSVTWSNTPTVASATAVNSADASDHLLITSAGAQFQGLVQPVPGAYPYTITACLADTDLQGTSDRGGGLILGPATPTGTSNLVYVGDANLVRFAGMYNFNGTFVSVAGVQPTRTGRLYVKIRVNSATSIDSWINHLGSGWVRRHNTFNPGFTPGVMGLAASRGTGGAGSSSFFAWFRVS